MEEKKYDKMEEYISAVYNVFYNVKEKSTLQNDHKLKMISLAIFNYVRYMAKNNNVDLTTIQVNDSISLMTIFEYIAFNNIELYDFSNIKMQDVDVTKKEDLERYVLTHIYYITQTK